MKTPNVVILVVVTSVISIACTFLIISAVHTGQERTAQISANLEKATAPVPAAPVAAPQPAVDKDKIIALFDFDKESRRKKTLAAFKKVMRDVPPYIGTGTKGYPAAVNGEYEKAVQTSIDEIKDNPDVVGPRYTLAWVYARTGSYDKAMAVCNDALQRGPAFNNMRYLVGWIYAKQGKYDEALKTCDDAINVDPYSAMLYYAKGRILELFGHNEEAIDSYKRAINLKADFTEAYVFLGLLYTELGQYDDAIKAEKEAISLNKYGPSGYLGLGLAYDEKGNYQAALGELKNAVTLGSFNVDSEAANKPLTLSIGIDDAVIYNRIGVLNARLGNYQDAVTAFNRAIAARQDYPEAYRGLILTDLLLNDKAAARKNYDKLKNMDADLAKSVAAVVGAGE